MHQKATSGGQIDWLREISHDASLNRISRRTNIPYSTLYKHVQANALSTDEIIAIARSYGINPIKALMDNHVVTYDEASSAHGNHKLRLCSIESIANEIVRRSTEE